MWTGIRTAGAWLVITITTSEGENVLVVGVYGVSGASLAGFESQAGRVRAERRLAAFVHQQWELAEARGCLLIPAGDINSVACVGLDTWGGTYVDRPDCLAHLLQEEGLEDTFRARHPDLRGFTYYTTGTSASRLDAIWIYRPAGLEVRVLNATVLWGWEKRADHEPALLDLLLILPVVKDRAGTEPALPWKDLIARMSGTEQESLAAHVRAVVAVRRRHFDAVEVELGELRRRCVPNELFSSKWEGMDGLHLDGARGDGRSPEL